MPTEDVVRARNVDGESLFRYIARPEAVDPAEEVRRGGCYGNSVCGKLYNAEVLWCGKQYGAKLCGKRQHSIYLR